jgi:Lanthionine synthetase C-like protein
VLYRPEAFEALTDEPWNDEGVRAAIRTIVADADAAFDEVQLWPAHEWDGWKTPLPLTTLYVGAAGVIWALDALRRRGHAESSLDLRAAALRALEAWRTEPDLMRDVQLPAHAEAGLLSGETGVLLVAWRLAPGDDLARDLLARVRESMESDANEVMWGAPGGLFAARMMWESTRDERWADAWRELADSVWAQRDGDGLWTHHLYGEDYRGLGPPHGVVGNVLALLRGAEWLGKERPALLARETADVLGRTAFVDDGLANWPGSVRDELSGSDGQIRVQWCTGSPGIVISAASYLEEELLLAGAELAWRAGPHGMEKGPCLCHGTAGGGYAFLKAFERTADEVWLDRARRFAVHALEQVARGRADRGRGRYSLWTGDVGVALFAADCLDARARFPVLDGA